MSDERATDDGQAGERQAPAESPDPAEHLFEEKDRIEGLNRIRQLVFGSLDGMLVPPGVVSAVAGGTGSSTAAKCRGVSPVRGAEWGAAAVSHRDTRLTHRRGESNP